MKRCHLASSLVVIVWSTLALAQEDAPSEPLLRPVTPPARVLKSWTEALALAEARSLDFLVALEDLKRADASRRVALAAALPTLDLGANITQSGLRTVINPLTGSSDTQFFPSNALTYGGSATLAVPIVDLRVWYAIGTADAAKEMSRLQMVDQRRLLVTALTNALVGVVTAERLSEVARVNLKAAVERWDLIKRRAELGVATQLDVTRAERDLAIARASVVSSDESLRQAREALGLALGLEDEVGVAQTLKLDEVLTHLRSECDGISNAIHRTDVQAGLADIKVRTRGVKDQNLSFLPTVKLSTTYSATAQPLVNNIVDTTYANHNWSISGLLSWSLFDGGARYGRKRDAVAQVNQARARFESTKRTARVQITRALRGVKVADTSMTIALQAQQAAAETEKLARINYELGRGTAFDLVESGQRLREAEIQRVIQELNVLRASFQAYLGLSVCKE